MTSVNGSTALGPKKYTYFSKSNLPLSPATWLLGWTLVSGHVLSFSSAEMGREGLQKRRLAPAVPVSLVRGGRSSGNEKALGFARMERPVLLRNRNVRCPVPQGLWDKALSSSSGWRALSCCPPPPPSWACLEPRSV